MDIPIQVESGDRILPGMLHLPAGLARGAPLILVHYGLNGDRVDNHRLAVLLARRAKQAGFGLMRFDYSGCGLGETEFQETSISTKIADAIAALDFVSACLHEDPHPFVLLGYSDGIRIVHGVLQQRPGIAALALWNPVVRSMTRTFRSTGTKRMRIDPTTHKLLFPLFGLYMGMDYLAEANRDLPIEDVLAHRLPKAFIFGTGDEHTSAFQQELRALRGARNDFDLMEIANANHLFSRETWSEELVRTTLEWIGKHSSQGG